MSIIYVVGPSGGGKSTLCRAVVLHDRQLIHINLDEKVKKALNVEHVTDIPPLYGWQRFWDVCKETFERLSKESTQQQIHIIDVGAGALQTTEGQKYMIEQAQQLICISASPQIVFERKHKGKRSYEAFLHLEFSPERIKVYNAAVKTIDTSTDNLEVAEGKFREAIYAIRGAV